MLQGILRERNWTGTSFSTSRFEVWMTISWSIPDGENKGSYYIIWFPFWMNFIPWKNKWVRTESLSFIWHSILESQRWCQRGWGLNNKGKAGIPQGPMLLFQLMHYVGSVLSVHSSKKSSQIETLLGLMEPNLDWFLKAYFIFPRSGLNLFELK